MSELDDTDFNNFKGVQSGTDTQLCLEQGRHSLNKKRLGRPSPLKEINSCLGFKNISKRVDGMPVSENKSVMHDLNRNPMTQSKSPNKTAVHGLNLKGLINSSKKHLKFEESQFRPKDYKGAKSELKLNKNLKNHLRQIISKNNVGNMKSKFKL